MTIKLESSNSNNTTKVFKIYGEENKTFVVKKIKDGIIYLENDYHLNLPKMLSEAFDENSNFFEEVGNAFCTDYFRGISIKIGLVSSFIVYKKMEEKEIEEEINRILASDAQCWVENTEARKKRDTEIQRIISDIPMEFKSKKAKTLWENNLENESKTPYNYHADWLITFAEPWAKYMQYLKKHEKVSDISDIANRAAIETHVNTLNSHELAYIVLILAQCWRYGTSLLNWYSKNWLCFGTDD